MQDRFRVRVWNKEEKKMIYNAEYAYDGMNYSVGDLIGKNNNDGHVHCLAEYLNDPTYEPMQCTGLKDKNGKLIFEGDIIQNWGNTRYKVVWKENAACFLVEHLKWNYTQGIYRLISLENALEVIGNIYENPELLEVRNEKL